MRTSSLSRSEAYALASDLRQWWRRWRHHQRGYELGDRVRTHYLLARSRAFARWPLHGNAAELLRTGRLQVGRDVVIASHVSLTGVGDGEISIGEGTFIGIGTQISAVDRVDIGAHCQIAFGCFVSDFDHAFEDPAETLVEQGLRSKGPTRIGDHVWMGAHAVVTSGVTIGERCVVGANAVVTSDVPPRSVVAGVPARVVRTFGEDEQPDAPRGRFTRPAARQPAA